MANIHINIGSNENRKSNLHQAITSLKQHFNKITCSEVFESLAFGFVGQDFYNIGVNAQTELSITAVIAILHQIEDNQGRDRSCAKFSSRPIDLDLTLYEQVISPAHNLPRDDILKYNFVLLPLAQLSPNSIHPLAHKTYAELSVAASPLKSYNIAILTE
jgi:2-amino-4-hydroxy-6-hydroxymethyldihydropteridine diphosphokinase